MEVEENQVPHQTETSGMGLAAQPMVENAVNFELLEVSSKGHNESKLTKEIPRAAEHEVRRSIETSDVCFESQHEATDTVEDELRDLSSKNQNEVNPANEIVQALEHEVSLETSLDSHFESYPANTKEVLEVPSGTGTLVMNLESQHVVEDAVDFELQDGSSKGHIELKLAQKNLEAAAAEHEVVPSIETSGKCLESLVVTDAVENEVQDVSSKSQNEVKPANEIVQASEHKVLLGTSLDLHLESYPANKEVVLHELEAKSDVENQKCNIASTMNVPSGLEKLDATKNALNGTTGQHVEIVHEPSFEEKGEEDFSVSLVEDKVHSPEGSEEINHYDGVSSEIMLPETETTVPVLIESFLSSNGLRHGMEIIDKSLASDVVENQKCNAAYSINVQIDLEKVDATENFLNGTGQHVEIVQKPFFEEKGEENFSDSHVQDKVHDPEGSKDKIHYNDISSENMLPGKERKTPALIESFLPSNDPEHGSNIVISNTETFGPVCTSSFGGSHSQIIENAPFDHESLRDESLVSDFAVGAIVCTKADSFLQGDDDAPIAAEVSTLKAEASSYAPAIAKIEHEVRDSTTRDESLNIDVTAMSKTQILDGFDVDEEDTSNIESGETGMKDMGDQLVGASQTSNGNLFMPGNDDSGNSTGNKSRASQDGSTTESIVGEHANIEAFTKPFNVLIRIPRFNTDVIKDQIRLAKLQVDEKTNTRDAIRLQIQEKRASSQIQGLDFEYAKLLDRKARKLVRSKRMEIDSIYPKINRAKNAISIEAIDEQVYNLEYMIQHETLPLKEEKQLIRDIKLLKQLRDQLSSNIGSPDEIQEALEQRVELEERSMILRKELEVLKEKVLETEAAAVETELKYANEVKVVKELQAQYKAAADARQAAYTHWQSLRKELAEKNKHFFDYKDAAAAARNYAYNRDTEALYNLCKDEVEHFMELWNSDNQFRRDYVRFNERSTVRRLGTLDGRSLGPGEEPRIVPSYIGDRIVPTSVMVDSISQNPARQLNQETTVEVLSSDDKLIKKEHKIKEVKNMGSSEPAFGNVSVAFPVRDVTDEVHEEPWRSREEIELARKEEEVRREVAEAKFREQRRLEGLAKAKEACERKKRQAEKVQMKAELKAQKEAEEREKEREKRLKKKERKKAAATDANGSNNGENAASSEGSVDGNEMEAKGMTSSVAAKKPKKHSVFAKQNKAKSIPLALRSRNKKKWQQYAWVCVTCIIVLVLFWVGNIGLFSNISFRRHNPVY